ncbi:HigA family addiction module antidote protein [Enterobacter sp. K16B]|uniref:HigA family addiction module antitoxin n=1 Tax=Enterobacter sp. K16B TaxID=2878537 RepID=UPI001CD9199D|nr:HigA family addiction module antitoxin [Enterobacter sp. K16B]MCA2025020.1 HigA family addiction module antidote protein [Enterobacter sp. K16B]
MMNNQKKLRISITPGEVLLHDYLKPLNLGISELADRLNTDHTTASALVNNKIKLTVDLAIRLANVFDTSVEFWLNLQQNAENQEARIEYP